MENNKIKNILLSGGSVYLSLTALISLVFVGHILITRSVDYLIAISLLVSASLMLATIGVNFNLMKKPALISEKKAGFNIIICALQSFSILSNGFSYRYVQGFEWGVFFHINQTPNQTMIDTFFSMLTFEVVLNFRSMDGLTIAINFIALFLAIFYVVVWKSIDKNGNT